VKPIGAKVEHALSIGSQIGEVGREHGRSNFGSHSHYCFSGKDGAKWKQNEFLLFRTGLVGGA